MAFTHTFVSGKHLTPDQEQILENIDSFSFNTNSGSISCGDLHNAGKKPYTVEICDSSTRKKQYIFTLEDLLKMQDEIKNKIDIYLHQREDVSHYPFDFHDIKPYIDPSKIIDLLNNDLDNIERLLDIFNHIDNVSMEDSEPQYYEDEKYVGNVGVTPRIKIISKLPQGDTTIIIGEYDNRSKTKVIIQETSISRLGECDNTNHVIRLYTGNIDNGDVQHDSYLIAEVYVHEMIHAYYDTTTYIEEIEEPIVEYSMLNFLDAFECEPPYSIYKGIKQFAYNDVLNKKTGKGISHYGFGAYLYISNETLTDNWGNRMQFKDWIDLFKKSHNKIGNQIKSLRLKDYKNYFIGRF